MTNDTKARIAYPAIFALLVVAMFLEFPDADAQGSGQHGLARLGADMALQAQRTCLYPAGGWTIVDCSNVAAATSGQLNAYSRYVIQCTDASYWAMGASAAMDAADSSDGYIPDGEWLPVLTTDTIRYFSCLNKTGDFDCRYLECT